MTLSESVEKEKPSVQAAVFLWSLELLRQHQAPCPKSTADIFTLTGASKSQGYAMLAQLKQAVASGLRPVGRPATPPDEGQQIEVSKQVREFLMAHPKVVHQHGTRRRYHEPFRRFVIDLIAPDGPAAALTIEQFSEVVGVPCGTLKQWLQSKKTKHSPPSKNAPKDVKTAPSAEAAEQQPLPSVQVQSPQLATILTEWVNWRGDFTSFCFHIKTHCRLDFGATFISTVLEAAGMRQRQRRGNSPAAPYWSKGTYKTCFPGAQWLGDGKTVKLTLNAKDYRFNWEAMMDVASNGIVGFKVTDQEDEAAVIGAFEAGQKTTGQPPLAVSLDQRPSNHSPSVVEALSPAVLLPTTPGRGQAKAPIEGMFGLFEQTIPPLNIAGKNQRALARSIVTLLLTLWSFARNGKPRRRLGGLCPAAFYHRQHVTQQDIQAAKSWIQELHRRAERAQQTRLQRMDPIKRQLVNEALIQLKIDDPEQRISQSLCTYATSAILRGIATFRTKHAMGTIPPDADGGRYLGGIIRNLHHREELERTASHLLQQRLRHQELSLAPLQLEAQRLNSTLPQVALVERFVSLALEAVPLVDFLFWGNASAKALRDVSEGQASAIYPGLTRKIAAAFSVTKQRREDLIAWLAEASTVPTLKGSIDRLTKT